MGHRNISSTFPIPREEILWRKLKKIGASPVTWGAGLAALASVLIVPSLGVGLLVGAGILGGAGWFWKKRLPEIEEAVVKEIIAGSNRTQDQTLSRAVTQLQKWDCEDYAKQLNGILSLKRQVEFAIHSQDPRTSIDENVESLVDTLCNEVSRDLFKMADIRYTMRKKRKRLPESVKDEMRADQRELGDRVEQAQAALKDVETQLMKLTGKTIPDQGDNPVLDRTIKRLREEADLASRIRARIDNSFGAELESCEEEEPATTTYSGGSMESQ